MASSPAALLLASCILVLIANTWALKPAFWERFRTVWGHNNVRPQLNGRLVQAQLNRATGSAFESYDKYMYGYISARMKLVPRNSAGVVTTFYMSSKSDAHDELDLEFLGNVTGQPYVLHTNIFVDGVGGREVRITLWFDPSADYHSYAILWNKKQIVFLVDNVPIRVLRYTPATPFPRQPMYVYGSIWDASNWATRGGRDKIDWPSAPFTASFTDFDMDDSCHCPANQPYPYTCVADSWRRWWNQPATWSLTKSQRDAYSWVRQNFVVYDYCTDAKRYPVPPPECLLAL